MEQIDKKTTISYRYEDEKEAEIHEKLMISVGWSVISRKSYFLKHYREYAKQISDGAWL
jgi:hypothetical protein